MINVIKYNTVNEITDANNLNNVVKAYIDHK